MEQDKDPREVELSEINTQLKTVMHLLKNGHTLQAVEEEISLAQDGIGDESEVFIFHDASSFKGSRHLQSLLRLERALDTKVQFAGRKNIHKESAKLLERKVALMRELHGV
jgi:hypothetical protein